ncbi:hypothetical protein GF406_10110 [candidate division KSB1 bacterium]|nr:hypothetical protein [candidate division KSB1 bacterium]
MYLFIIVLSSLVLFFSSLFSQSSGQPSAFSTGLDVGDQVRDFKLPDQNDNVLSLSKRVGPNGAILNFFRSVVW